MGHPTIYPTGATIYSPTKAWSGYTIFQAPDLGALLIDMNGREVHLWKGLRGFPNKIFPGDTPLIEIHSMVFRMKEMWRR